MVAAHQQLPVSGQATQERGDAARNRELLLDAARQHGVSLMIATHDARLKSRIARHLALHRNHAEAQP